MNDLDSRGVEVIALHNSGHTYAEIRTKTGLCYARLAKLLRGKRSLSAAGKLARSKGHFKIEDKAILSARARIACIASRKFWTSPEREFRRILNEINIGIRFPVGLAILLNENDDLNPEIDFQYAIQRYLCDFVDVSRRIIYRINGDYWHANPILYNDDKLTKPQIHNRRQDRCSKIYFERHGWHVCDIWESEIKWNRDLVKTYIRATRVTANPPGLQPEISQFESEVAQWSSKLHKLWFQKSRVKVTESRVCRCGLTFVITTIRDKKYRKFCSTNCMHFYARKVDRPSVEQLRYDMLQLKFKSVVARKYKVSDRTINKWLQKE